MLLNLYLFGVIAFLIQIVLILFQSKYNETQFMSLILLQSFTSVFLQTDRTQKILVIGFRETTVVAALDGIRINTRIPLKI